MDTHHRLPADSALVMLMSVLTGDGLPMEVYPSRPLLSRLPATWPNMSPKPSLTDNGKDPSYGEPGQAGYSARATCWP